MKHLVIPAVVFSVCFGALWWLVNKPVEPSVEDNAFREYIDRLQTIKDREEKP